MNVDTTLVPVIYLVSAVLFVFGLKRLGRVKTARSGNAIAALGMLLAVVGSLLELGLVDYRFILGGVAVGSIVGVALALRVQMTGMPELVAFFNGLGGAASALVALAAVWGRLVDVETSDTVASELGGAEALTVGLSIFVGAITLTGSVLAFLKLKGRFGLSKPVLLPARHAVHWLLLMGVLGLAGWLAFGATDSGTIANTALALTFVSLLLGGLIVLPIGGADMPVVVSLLNSYSGLAASAAGFVLGNPILIIAGAMVGAAGLVLTQIMCVAMNRSLIEVLLGGFGVAVATDSASQEYESVTSCGAEEAAMLLETAESVVFVPGYGLAVAQAQHAVRELAGLLEERGAKIQYAIHPVAGRMPGHMNVLLAEADVPHEQLVEMDVINPELRDTDVAIVLGANDVVNPVAGTDPSSPIYGMPIVEVARARSVFVVKRSLSPGYAGIKNELFEHDNTMMLFGDAKKVLQDLAGEMKAL